MSNLTTIETKRTQRLSGKLGRKFALVILPLVLIPLILMGLLTYFRMRSTLREDALDQMIYAVQGQSTVFLDWASIREQRLFIASQRTNIQNIALEFLVDPEDQEAISSAQDDLKELLSGQSGKLFTETLLLRRFDSLVVSSTNNDHNGLIIQNPALIQTTEPRTFPIYNDPDLSPETLGLISITPLRVVGDQPDFYLVGINSGSEITPLIEELQVFWQQRGIYRIERGKTFLALSPEYLFGLSRYSTDLEVASLPSHDIFQTQKSTDAGVLEYKNDEGQSLLSAYQWIPGWNLALVVELPASDILSNLTDLAPFMVMLIIVAVILTLGVGFIATNRMLHPLTNLADFANRITQGEWLYRVPEDRDDELGALAHSLNRMADELGALYQSLETRVEERTQQIRTASEVARAIISIPNLNELLRQAAQLIKDRFGYDHVSIFLVDSSGQQAILRESAGEIEGVTHSSGHTVAVNSDTLVGWVIQNNSPRVITDTSDEPDLFKSEMLEGAHTQVTIPLQVAGRPLGVIDIQTTAEDLFKQDEFDVMQTLADQLSSAIENARLAQESADAAERALLISEISSQLSGILEPQQVLHTAANALHRALGDADIVVKLVFPEETSPEDLVETP